ncbi:OmpA family protein [candidate division KSB1 bacterium]|nr:OmpA family protein [candidate division KSB1 bacterium]
MQRLTAALLFAFGMLLAGSASEARGQAQDEQLYQQIFGKVQEKVGQARTAQADILSPDVFARAFKKYNEARDDFKRGRSLSEINTKLREVSTDLESAMNTAKVGKVELDGALKARNAALDSDAPQFAQESYATAERTFLDAARKFESGDRNGAKKRGEEAERIYREAELQAIKGSIIGSVRNQIIKAREVKVDRLAPLTFAKSEALLAEAEKILNSDRYAAGTAREKAEAAEYEIKHATQLAEQIQRVKLDERQWEKLLLDQQQQIASISKELDFSPQFAEGTEKPVNDIRQAIKSLRAERRDLTAEVSKMSTRMEELSRELNNIREAQVGLESQLEKEKRKQHELQQERQRREERQKALMTMFEPAEAKVLQESETVYRIRLLGLTFPPGKAVIQPQYFSLLTKLQRAIRIYPNAQISIEGHTDGLGNENTNQRISTERAAAIQQYLLANMSLAPESVQAVGYGESAPIASNETEDGRAQNRRIEVVLTVPAQ